MTSEPIPKKTWPDFFELMISGKKNVDVRLADFDLKEGDEILFREYCPKSRKYTGRSILRKVKNLVFVNFSQFNTVGEILGKGHYIMEFEGCMDIGEFQPIRDWLKKRHFSIGRYARNELKEILGGYPPSELDKIACKGD